MLDPELAVNGMGVLMVHSFIAIKPDGVQVCLLLNPIPYEGAGIS
jgi:hypothetical protein